jgi:hypothetical protein
MSVKWEPVLIALAQMIGGLRLKHWYEVLQNRTFCWQYTCMICGTIFHEHYSNMRFDESDTEMRARLVCESNCAVRANEQHATKHLNELEQRFGAEILDAAEAAIRVGMEPLHVMQDILGMQPMKPIRVSGSLRGALG